MIGPPMRGARTIIIFYATLATWLIRWITFSFTIGLSWKDLVIFLDNSLSFNHELRQRISSLLSVLKSIKKADKM